MLDPATVPPACPVCGDALPERAAIVGVDRLMRLPGKFQVRVCGRCGSGCTAPPVSEAELGDLYPAGYGSHQAGDGGAAKRLADRLKRAQVELTLRRRPFAGTIGPHPGRALDIGCGRGDLAAALIGRGWTVDGVEPVAGAAAVAGARGVSVVGATVATSDLAAHGYDLIVIRHALEHVLDPVGDLARLAASLRPAGRLVISLPNFASWQRRRFGGRWFHLDLPRHRVHFTPHSLQVALGRAGLAIHLQFESTSVLGLPASLQYLAIGRCVAPGGTRLRLLAGICCAVYPLTWAADRLASGRDTLHAVAAGVT